MIIVGYQGIGKSTLVEMQQYKQLSHMYIDLESSSFRNYETMERPDDWYIYYCQTAIKLSNDGFVVFVSSHKVVRDYLSKQKKVDVLIICPSLDLKDKWIERLENRFINTIDPIEKDKNYRALMNAKDRYDENIEELLSCDIPHVTIDNIEYNLDEIVFNAMNNYLTLLLTQ